MYVIMLFPFSIKFYVWVSSELLFELCLLFSGMQDCLCDLELFWTFWSQALSVFVFQNFAFDYFTSGFADFWITMSLLYFFFCLKPGKLLKKPRVLGSNKDTDAFLSAAIHHLYVHSPKWRFLCFPVCFPTKQKLHTAQLWCADLFCFVKLMK